MTPEELKNLTRMLQEGKITAEQYEELRTTLPGTGSTSTPGLGAGLQAAATLQVGKRDEYTLRLGAGLHAAVGNAFAAEQPAQRPMRIWIVSGLIAFSGIAIIFAGGTPMKVIAGIVNLLLAWGLFSYSKAAWWLMVVVTPFVLFALLFVKGSVGGFLVNLALWAMVLSVRRFYFPAEKVWVPETILR